MGQYHQIWAFDPNKESPPEHINHYALGAGAKLAEQVYTVNLYHDDALVALVPSPYSSAVALAAMSRWKNRRLVVIGDYAQEGDVFGWAEQFPVTSYYGSTKPSAPEDFNPRYYDDVEAAAAQAQAVHESVLDISQDATSLLAEASGITFDTQVRAWRDIVFPADYVDRIKCWQSLEDPTRYVIASGCGEYIRPEAFGSPTNGLAMPFIGAAWSIVIGLLAVSDGRGGGDLDLEPAGRWGYTNVNILAENKLNGQVDITDWVLSQDSIERWVLHALWTEMGF